MIHYAFLIEDNKLIHVNKDYYINNIKQYDIAVPDEILLIVTTKDAFMLYVNIHNIDITNFDEDFNLKPII